MINISDYEKEIKILNQSADYVFMFQGLLGFVSALLATFILTKMQEMSKNQRFLYGGLFILSIGISVLLPIKSRQIEAKINAKEETIRKQIDSDTKKELKADGDKHEENLAEIFGKYNIKFERVFDSTSNSYIYQISELNKTINNKDFGKKDEIALTILNDRESGKNDPNPVFTVDRNKKDIRFSIEIKSIGASVANIVNMQLDVITISKGNMKISISFPITNLEKDSYISKNNMYFEAVKHIGYDTDIWDSTYLALKINYTNQDGNIKRSLHKIYQLDLNKQGLPVPEPIPEQRIKFESLLKKKGLW